MRCRAEEPEPLTPSNRHTYTSTRSRPNNFRKANCLICRKLQRRPDRRVQHLFGESESDQKGDWFLGVWQFDCTRLGLWTSKDAVSEWVDIMALCVHSGDGESDSVPDYERYGNPFSPSQSVRQHIALRDFSAG
jgi:hypothetical protein